MTQNWMRHKGSYYWQQINGLTLQEEYVALYGNHQVYRICLAYYHSVRYVFAVLYANAVGYDNGIRMSVSEFVGPRLHRRGREYEQQVIRSQVTGASGQR